MANFEHSKQAIINKVAECIAIAEKTYGIKMPTVDVRFDLRGRVAGYACKDRGQYYLRFNTTHMRLGGQTWLHLLTDTVPHEVAHTVCQAFPQFGSNHDTGWKSVCIALGGNGKRCYSESDAPEAAALRRPFAYVTTTGHTIRVTKNVHIKIQSGLLFTTKKNQGDLTRHCSFTSGSDSVTLIPAVVTIEAPTGDAATSTAKSPGATHIPSGTKADAVRELIRAARLLRWDMDAVVNQAVYKLGMTKSLAKVYVKNNWAC
jgi:predicted SprT family Zn-dependent metalloprotease